MSEYLRYGAIKQVIEPHPLLSEGHTFLADDVVLVTEWGDILPPVEFSRRQFDELTRIAEHPGIFDTEDVVILSQYLTPKLNFDNRSGCWLLPLKAEQDEKGRARYPQVNIAALGYNKQLAHRATVEIFMGVSLPRGEGRKNMVDHRCRVHACCNPYHLEVVSHAENNRRGFQARRNTVEPTLFQEDHAQALTFGQLALLSSIEP